MAFLSVDKDFRDVKHALFDIRYKWKNIGLELGLTRTELNNLRRSDEENLDDVVEMWLKRRQLNPTWKTLVTALRQKTVDEDSVADAIEQKYLEEASR